MDERTLTVSDEYKEVSAFGQKGYTLMYQNMQLFLILNSAFVAIIGYSVTITATLDAATRVREWALFFVPILGWFIGCAASVVNRRMAKYLKEFLERGKEIESAVDKDRDNNDKILLFTKTLVSYRTGRETWSGRRLKTLYMVDFAYLVSSLFWVMALVILNDASRWSIVVAAVAFVFLVCFVRASSKFEKDDASYAQAVHRKVEAEQQAIDGD